MSTINFNASRVDVISAADRVLIGLRVRSYGTVAEARADCGLRATQVKASFVSLVRLGLVERRPEYVLTEVGREVAQRTEARVRGCPFGYLDLATLLHQGVQPGSNNG